MWVCREVEHVGVQRGGCGCVERWVCREVEHVGV